ncbi:hypothetical protein RSAG8_09696, partial [Rhizoctonia solani AG-8 WAC10335]
MGVIRVRFSLIQKRVMDAAYITAGGKMPSMRVRKE